MGNSKGQRPELFMMASDAVRGKEDIVYDEEPEGTLTTQ